mmetsp:Transcript_68191/g.154271  ORF Transcript_68191/g.154271 Transcript_68191/m.154271 type:complete len:212 (+) Transcript_68191:86-721(+)
MRLLGSKRDSSKSKNMHFRPNDDSASPRPVISNDLPWDRALVILFTALTHLAKLAGCLAVLCTAAMAQRSWSSMTRSILNTYTCGFGFTVVVAEFEWPYFFRLVPFLEGWSMRGVYQIFVGVLLATGALLEADSEESDPTQELLVSITGNALMVTGGFYILVGGLCARRLNVWRLRHVRQTKGIVGFGATATCEEDIEGLLAETESKLQAL